MDHIKAILAVLLVLASFSITATSLTGPEGRAIKDLRSTRQATDPIETMEFEGFIAYKETDLLFRAASGDILPERSGYEVATCSRNGVVAVTYGSDLSWTTEKVWRSTFGDNPNDPAHVYSIAVADLLPDRPGDEIVTVDMDDSVELIWKGDSDWEHMTVFRDTQPATQMWLYEVAVGEVMGTPPGPDIISVGDAGRTFVSSLDGEVWSTDLIYTDPLPLDTCIIGDILPLSAGNEIAVAGKGGDIIMLSWDGSGHKRENIAELGSNVMDLVLADLDPDVKGAEVYSTTYSGGLYMTYSLNGSWHTERAHFEGSPIYGLEKGSLDGTDVLSMATWNNRIALLYYDSGFKVREVYRDDYLMMGTGIFDMDPYHKGNEVIGLSFYGRLHMFYHDDPGADLLVPFDECVVTSKEVVSLPLIVRLKGGFDGKVDLEVSGKGATLSSSSVDGEGMVELKMTAPSSSEIIPVKITARTTVSTVSREISFKVESSGGFMDFDRHLIEAQVGSDRQFRGTFELLSNNDMGMPFVLEPGRTPMGLRLDLINSVCDPLGTPIPLGFTLTAEPWLRPSTYLFFLTGSLFDGRARAIGFEVKVTEISISDFILTFEEDRVTSPEGTEISVEVLLQSISGFSDEVVLSLPDEVQGLTLSLSETSVIPTAVIVLTIRVDEGTGPFFIRLVGTGGNLTREDILRLDTIPRTSSLTVSAPMGPLSLERVDGTYQVVLNVTLTPQHPPISLEPIEIEGLPEGFEASISPSEIKTLPYAIDITIWLRSKDNLDRPFQLAINVTPEGSTDHIRTELEVLPYEGNEDGETEGLPLGLLIFLIVCVGIISGVIVLLLVGRRLSNYGGSNDPRKGQRSGHKRAPVVPPLERPHGLGRGPDRMVRKR